ncbi:DUF4031 domain-containing protein [Kordiimonas sp. SCSIO 12610]|uniref:DUF4031 domain-containing protein n=1 Tax=Kordiimonas sp. SCSIO 12610 TaxID=2829597 RepID=UPI00210E8007|nr:DUF4031 domain-containing protein [Kordiimonas sp. SCSIO 12610]UTW56691.1 DUF4031 domain-containing protein [Kordiimonas sp. SCSIO 12610]
MTVYVDNAMIPFRGMRMSHMLADTRDELLHMATLLQTDHKWIQYKGTHKEHFDICERRRLLALEYGAIAISYKQAGRIVYRRRKGL